MFFFGRRNMVQRESRKINARIKKLRRLYAKMELRGCASDAELRAKEAELDAIRDEILRLQNAREKLWSSHLIRDRLQDEAAGLPEAKREPGRSASLPDERRS